LIFVICEYQICKSFDFFRILRAAPLAGPPACVPYSPDSRLSYQKLSLQSPFS
jgi:hypothetical protein